MKTTSTKRTPVSQQATIDALELRLKEAESTLEAIREGAVDALVVRGSKNQEIFTLQSADYTYRRLVESMNQGALTIDFDGTILYSNKQFSTMLDMPLERIIGDSILTYVIASDRSKLKELLMGSQQPDIKIEVGLRSAQGKQLTVIASITTVAQTGMKPYLGVIVTDLTERKQAEDAKDEFISLASHQLRTPATAVKQYINMLIDGLYGSVTSIQKEALLRANEGNDRGLKVVEDLLKIAQIDAGKIILHSESINLDTVLTHVIAEQSVQVINRHQSIQYKRSSTDVSAYVDENLIYMVLENLIDNASKYMLEGKAITVRLSQKNNQAIISVKDQGVGIMPEDLPKLFNKFTRLPNMLSIQVGGNGLGLYWVKKVINLHNGKITVSSKLDKGTTFSIYLPQGEFSEQGPGRR